MTTINNYIIQLSEQLNSLYNPLEAKAISELYICETLNITKTEKILKQHEPISNSEKQKLDKHIKRLLQGEPIQYILESAWFYDLKFIVNNNVLIPRQETEILVNTIIKNYKNNSNINILDIGTGSGCIPISIKKNIPSINVFGIDISTKALNVAKANAQNHDTQIIFSEYDILSKNKFPHEVKFDIIISNPPYVLDSEKILMHKNILNYEPKEALYVSDKDPLIFYRHILNFSKSMLNKRGELIFEINEKFATEIVILSKSFGFTNSNIIKDLNNKDRFIFLKY